MKTASQCCASDCSATVATGLYFCPDCWALVPLEHREAMRAAHRPLLERNLPLNRAVLVSKHQEAILAAANAIVRPVTAPEPALHLCPGDEVAEPLAALVVGGFFALAPPVTESLLRLPSRIREGCLKLLFVLAPSWAMGLAPTRDAAMTLVVQVEAAMAQGAPPLTPGEWGEAAAALIRCGVIAERLYGRITHHDLGADHARR